MPQMNILGRVIEVEGEPEPAKPATARRPRNSKRAFIEDDFDLEEAEEIQYREPTSPARIDRAALRDFTLNQIRVSELIPAGLLPARPGAPGYELTLTSVSVDNQLNTSPSFQVNFAVPELTREGYDTLRALVGKRVRLVQV